MVNMQERKPKLIIIGGGISGLSAGIYALDNGFEVHIYEKHTIAGGQCTGWIRKGMYIDGCAHWIVGTNPKSDLFPLWKYVGAFDEATKIHPNDYFLKFALSDGRIFTLWSDIKKLRKELLSFGPQDWLRIHRFLLGIWTYSFVRVPVKKPIDLMNLWEKFKFGISFVPMGLHYLRYKWQSTERYAQRFKSDALREVFLRVIDNKYCVHSLFYIMQALHKKDAGMLEGGSLAMAQRIKQRFESMGGHIHLHEPVKRIVVEDGVAKGIELCSTGEFIPSDYVIAAADMHHVLYDLLEGKVPDKEFEEKVNNRIDNPLITGIIASFKLDGKHNNSLPKMLSFPLKEPIQIGSLKLRHLILRNHAFDTMLYPSDVTLTTLIDLPEDVFPMLQAMPRSEYLAYKKDLGERLRKEILQYFKLNDEAITLLDVATPLTHHRYTNAWQGSYMSFLTTIRSRELMRKGIIKGIRNFYLAGQWLMSPGGLPIALFTGRHAIVRLQHDRGKKFIAKDF